eukprot:scaffold56746_cov57-Attheya_sp.AAC.3
MSEDVSYFGKGRDITDEERKWSESASTNDSDGSFFDQFISIDLTSIAVKPSSIAIPEDAPLTQGILEKDAERIEIILSSIEEGNSTSNGQQRHDEDYESDEDDEKINAESIIRSEEYERMSRKELIQIIELQNSKVRSTEQYLRREEREIKYKAKCMARLATHLRSVQIELRGAQAHAKELKKTVREEREKRNELEKYIARSRRDKMTIKKHKTDSDKEESAPVEEPENSAIEAENSSIEPETPNTKRRRNKVDERRRKLMKQGSLAVAQLERPKSYFAQINVDPEISVPIEHFKNCSRATQTVRMLPFFAVSDSPYKHMIRYYAAVLKLVTYKEQLTQIGTKAKPVAIQFMIAYVGTARLA